MREGLCEDIAFVGFGACIPKLMDLEILQNGHKKGHFEMSWRR